MSYPNSQYLGNTGEASATLRPGDTAPDLVYPNGTRCSYIATGKTTRGLFGIYKWEMTGEPSGPGPHFHRTFTESFYVLSGAIRVYDGRAWVDAREGDFLHVPEGGIHGFRNELREPASMLIHFAPGAPREEYFESNARFARDGKPSDEEMAEFYLRHDNHIVPEGDEPARRDAAFRASDPALPRSSSSIAAQQSCRTSRACSTDGSMPTTTSFPLRPVRPVYPGFRRWSKTGPMLP